MKNLRRILQLFIGQIENKNYMKSIVSPLNINKLIHIFCLISMPIVMLMINDNWLFTRLGYLDPWYNVGYFLHYDDPSFRPDHYKIARASWLIPGFVAYEIFTPLVANYVLHIGCLVLTTIFIYLALSRIINRDISFITAAMLSVYYPIHGSGGWDYQTTPSGAYFALTLYSMCRAGQHAAQLHNPMLWLWLAGAAFAATFHANIIFINTLPIIFAFYIVLSGNKIINIKTFKVFLHFCLGFLGLTFLLGLINLVIGRQFLFYSPLIEIVINYIKDTSNQETWWLPWSSGWYEKDYAAGYLALPAALLVIGTGLILYISCIEKRIFSLNEKITILLIGQYVFIGWIWVIWQSIGQTALVPDYFAYPVQLSAFIGLAGIMSLGNMKLSFSDANLHYMQQINITTLLMLILKYLLVSTIFVILLVLPIATTFATQILNKYSMTDRAYFLYASALMIVCFIVMISIKASSRYSYFVIAASMFIFIQVATITAFVYPDEYNKLTSQHNSAYSSAKEYVSFESCLDRRGSYLALLEIEQAVRKYVPASHVAYVLWDPTLKIISGDNCVLNFTDLGSSFSSISSHYFAQDKYTSEIFSNPLDMPEESFVTFSTDTPLVILTNDQKYVDGVLGRFKKAEHLNMEIREKRFIKTKNHSFYSYILMGPSN